METSLEKSPSFVVSQLQDLRTRLAEANTQSCGPAMTISHQTGAGAHDIAESLARVLQSTEPPGAYAWTVFGRELVEKALEEHHWPKALADRMPEDRRAYIDDVMEELFGLRPPSWVLVPQVAETTLRLAAAGHVILVGRGATVVTARLPNVFHVRLIASLSTRIERVQKAQNLTREAAAVFVGKADRGRQRYVKAHFDARIDDEMLYDLVVNTDRLSYADAVTLIAEAGRSFFRKSAVTGEAP
jgi:cytidylate kinase